MTDLAHVDAQLMGSTGDGRELHQSAVGLAAQHAPAGQRVFAVLVTDFLQRSVEPVCDQGQIHLAPISLDDTRYSGYVGFIDASFLKLARQCGECFPVAGYHHDARCIEIQAVNRTHAGVTMTQAR